MVMQALDGKRIPSRGIAWVFVASAGIVLAAAGSVLAARNSANVPHPAAVQATPTQPNPSQAHLVAAAHHLNTAWFQALAPGALLVDDSSDGSYGVHKVELVVLDMRIDTEPRSGTITAVTYDIDVLTSGNACSRHADAKPRYNLGPAMPAHGCGFQTPEEALKATKSDDFVGGSVPVRFHVSYVPDGKTLRLASANSIFTEIMAPHLHSGFTPTRNLMKRLYAFPAG